MSDFGFTLCLGRPLSQEFRAWARAIVAASPAFARRPDEALHATIANCTPPNGRSLASLDSAAAIVPALRTKLLAGLPEVLPAAPFSLDFQRVTVAGGLLIVESKASVTVADFRRRLQGGCEWIADEKTAAAMERDEVLAIDKFSSRAHRLADTVAVTVADVHQPVRLDLSGFSLPPVEPIDHVKLVFYRERTLSNALISAPLRFAASVTDVRQEMNAFFAQVIATLPGY